jgi:succinate dehydrogenase/fumarate reductase flavoprotein subunit
MSGIDTRFDKEVDVLVVGAGGGGMAAALRAADLGLDTLVIEKAKVFGGSTALSGGGAWAPNSPQLLEHGERDDPAKLVEYLQRIAPDVSRARHERYVQEVPRLMEFLSSKPAFEQGFAWTKGYSDYHPDLGGSPLGRGVWAQPVNRKLLGEDEQHLRTTAKRMSLPRGVWLTSAELRELFTLRWGGWRGKWLLLVMASRIVRSRLFRLRMTSAGQSLALRLYLALREAGVPVWRETPMKALITDEGGRVVGVEAERNGAPYRIGARGGVVLATGGFDHNPEMRLQYQPEVEPGWSSGSKDNQGDGIRAGIEIGAAVDLMDDAWWMPSIPFPDGSIFGCVAERQYPGQFIVNAAGKRFVNESAPYTDFGHAQIEGHRTGGGHIPAWMIFDSKAWKRNFIAGHVPGQPMGKWGDALTTAGTLRELAEKLGISPDALVETAERFNGFARNGVDQDFRRGESAYDNYYGDRSYKNPNLGEVEEPPFYALPIVPGDLGTKGGLLTDEDARVLRPDGAVISGLYATGNTSAAVMGRDYAGPGATLGPAMTFGYLAASHIAASRGDHRMEAVGVAAG